MLKTISFIALFAALVSAGCAGRQTKTVPVFAQASVQAAPATQESVKEGVIAIEIKSEDLKLVATEKFDRPTSVVRGACPKSRVFSEDGHSRKLGSKECLTWRIDAGEYFVGLRSTWSVMYVFGSVTSPPLMASN